MASNTAIMQGLHYVLLGQCIDANPYTASVSNYSISEHIAFVILDVDKARSSERYDSVDWWRLDIHDLGFKPRLIWTPAI